MIKKFFYTYKICNLFEYTITEENEVICGVITNSDTRHKKTVPLLENTILKETPLIKAASMQINEYLNKKRKFFDLPVKPKGTEFQLKVWKALQAIPYGKTRSYGDIAAAIGSPKASRAVGMANNKNPIHIIIPCHRVIGADGSLTGYAGGIEIKKLLLNLES